LDENVYTIGGFPAISSNPENYQPVTIEEESIYSDKTNEWFDIICFFKRKYEEDQIITMENHFMF